VELYLHSPACLYGVYRDEFSFINHNATLYDSGTSPHLKNGGKEKKTFLF
jgi:hypothetical protein